VTQLDLFVAGLVFQAAYVVYGEAGAGRQDARNLFRAPPIRGNSLAFDWVLATREYHWLRGLTPIPPTRTWSSSTP
jgi:hypothetical protein